MRLPAVMLAAALAACQVDVEGAICAVPGDASECPAGQACGNDLRCTERAAECREPGSRCVPGTTRCAGDVLELCTAADASCGAWEVTSCSARGLVCGAQGHPAACECAAAGAELHVDASEGGSDEQLLPTGVASPPACRFGSITAALAAATAGTTVRVVGPAATYGGLPIRIPKSVALVSDPPDAAARILGADHAQGAGVVLEEGARLEGFTVRAAAGDPRPVAIEVSCEGAEKVTLSEVHVDAAEGAALGAGIEVEGGCDVDLLKVRIAGASGAGIRVAMAAATNLVRLEDAQVLGCGTGVQLVRGDLTLLRTTVAGSAGTGVEAGDGGADTRFTAADAVLAGNADTGLALFGNTRVDLRDNRICGNGAASARGALARKVGGLFVLGPPPTDSLVFARNEIHHNAAAQVFVTGTTIRWVLDGGTTGACSAERNLFFGYDAAVGRGLIADAPVDAKRNAWGGVTPTPPPLGQDYEALGTGVIDVGAAGLQYCQQIPAARPCP